MPRYLRHQPCRHAVAAEQQDDAEADDEGRRDDRQDGEKAEQSLGAESRALVQQRKAEAEQGRRQTDSDGEQQAVPDDAPEVGRQ